MRIFAEAILLSSEFLFPCCWLFCMRVYTIFCLGEHQVMFLGSTHPTGAADFTKLSSKELTDSRLYVVQQEESAGDKWIKKDLSDEVRKGHQICMNFLGIYHHNEINSSETNGHGASQRGCSTAGFRVSSLVNSESTCGPYCFLQQGSGKGCASSLRDVSIPTVRPFYVRVGQFKLHQGRVAQISLGHCTTRTQNVFRSFSLYLHEIQANSLKRNVHLDRREMEQSYHHGNVDVIYRELVNSNVSLNMLEN